MSITLTFDSEYFAETINGFENARKIYESASSNKRQALKLPSKVKKSNIKLFYRLIQVHTAVLKSSEVSNANILLSKQDCEDSSLKQEIDRSQAQRIRSIKKFLIDGSQTLSLQFVEKRVTRKRSGEFLNHLYLP